MIGVSLLLILYTSHTIPAQEIARWNVKVRIARSSNMDYGKDNIQYGDHSNIQYGSNNIQYGSNNIQYGEHNIQYGSSNNIQDGVHNIQHGSNNKQSGQHNIQYVGENNIQSGMHNIQSGSLNMQCGKHNIQYGVNHFQDGEHQIQYATDNNKVPPNIHSSCGSNFYRRKRAYSSSKTFNVNALTYEQKIQGGESNITSLPIAEDIYFSNGFNDNSNIALYFKVKKNNRAKAEDNFQDVRLITLTSSSPLQYNSGDTFMIRPRNCQNAIDDLFRMFNKHGLDIKPGYKLLVEAMHDSTPVPSFLQTPVSVHRIAEQYWDLTAYPTQDVFTLLANISEDKLEKDKCKKLSSQEGKADYLNNYSRRTILEVLNDFPETASKLTISNLFELFSTIKPQSFSIVSSNLRSPNSLDVLVAEHAEVENSTKLQMQRKGLCPNWLAGLSKEDGVYGWINKGSVLLTREK